MSHALHGEGDIGLPRHSLGRWLLLLSAALALVLGIYGHLEYHDLRQAASAAAGHQEATADHCAGDYCNALYHTLQLFILHTHFDTAPPLRLELARWLAAITTITGLGALLFGAFRSELQRGRIALMRGHTVVCGLGDKGRELLRQRQRARRSWRSGVVALDRSPGAQDIATCARLGVPLLTGDATRADVLKAAGVQRAREVFVVCDSDATNNEIALQIARCQAASRAEPLQCYVHTSTAEMTNVLQPFLAVDTAHHTRFHAVDAYGPEALALLATELPIDHDGVRRDETKRVNLVIVGFGRMGQALAVRAAQLGHFANGGRVAITVIDRHADRNAAALGFHHPFLAQAVKLEFKQLEVASPEALKLLQGLCADPKAITSVAVCFDDESLALETCLRLQSLRVAGGARFALRLRHDGGLGHLVEDLRQRPAATAGDARSVMQSQLASIRVFGTNRHFASSLTGVAPMLEDLAHRLHESYRIRAREAAAVDPLPPSQRPWDQLPADLRDSNRLLAAHAFIKLRAVGLEVAPANDPRPAAPPIGADDRLALAITEHRRWVAERLVANWTLGPKDVLKRTSPHLVGWEDLSPDIQAYDLHYVDELPALLQAAGFKLVQRAAPPA